MNAALVAALVVGTVLAGCSAGPAENPEHAAASSLSWPALNIHPTPGEPHEIPGQVRVEWGDSLFGIQAEGNEAGIDAKRVIVAGDTAYTTQTGMGWLRHDVASELASRALDPRIHLWDLRALVADRAATVRNGEFSAALGVGTGDPSAFDVDLATLGYEVRLHLNAQGGRIVSAHLDVPGVREAPFNFTLAPSGLAFPLVAPQESATAPEIAQRDAEAYDAQGRIVGLIYAYRRDHACAVPPSLDPETMSFEVTASGEPWPTNPYTQAPMKANEGHGDFGWSVSGPQTARFSGYAWDGLRLSKSFSPASPPKCGGP